VSYLTNLLSLTSYSACYQRLFPSKKKKSQTIKIELSSGEEEESIYVSSGDEDDTIEIKPKIEEMEPCCSSSLNS
jgi:hypothetical protein